MIDGLPSPCSTATAQTVQAPAGFLDEAVRLVVSPCPANLSSRYEIHPQSHCLSTRKLLGRESFLHYCGLHLYQSSLDSLAITNVPKAPRTLHTKSIKSVEAITLTKEVCNHRARLRTTRATIPAHELWANSEGIESLAALTGSLRIPSLSAPTHHISAAHSLILPATSHPKEARTAIAAHGLETLPDLSAKQSISSGIPSPSVCQGCAHI